MTRIAIAIPLVVLGALAGCGTAGGPAPRVEDPLGAGLPSLDVAAYAQDEAAVEAMLADYAKRFNEGYPLFPGDQIRLIVVGNAELSFAARVPAEGFLNLPHVGKVQLAGRTIEAVRTELVKGLGGYLVNPDVSVLVEQYARKSVSVLGAVEHPMDYEIPSGKFTTLLQAVSQAGGFRGDAEKRAVLIMRPKQIGSAERVTIPVDVVALTRGAKGKDPIILPDDVIFIPARDKVYVFGQVTNPGAYLAPADHPTTITGAISQAGGFTRIAKEGSVQLLRRQKDGTRATYKVDVGRILGGHPEEDVPLQPGDVIFVPESFF